ncbi:MAG: alpha-L-fucosidase [Draconibacterium sp.]|nr:alpha-L-fucosidase [Draconibacterium sp.]
MKNIKINGLSLLLLMLLISLSSAGQQRKNVVSEKKGKDILGRSVLEQWKYERFGMFIHWGVYSGPSGVFHGETCPGFYAEHLMRLFEIPLEVYKKEVVAKFNPVKFNADEWVKTLKSAGMGYMVITAKHHDGFAMFDSDVTDYNIVDATPFHRDPMAELKRACEKAGVLFGFYYSHAQDWADPNGVRNTWDFEGQPTKRQWFKTDSSYYRRIKKYYYQKSIPQLIELIKKYDPDIIWFDTANWGPEDLNKAVVDTALKYKPNLIINSRGAGTYRATYKSTNDKPVEFPHKDGLWEAIPSTNESYGHHKFDHTHHSSGYLIELIVKAAAQGGNMLLNIGPKGDGTIDIVDQGILGGIGEWMQTNGEAIKGTEKNPLPTQSFGEITRKGNILYCHIFQWPKDGKLIVAGLTSKVRKAYLLTNPEDKTLPVNRINLNDVEITIPDYPQERPVAVLALECEDIVPANTNRLLLTNIPYNKLHVIDAVLHGKKLAYAGGNWRTDFLKGWVGADDYAQWDIRNNIDSFFDIYISYDADVNSDGNKYEVIIDGQHFEKTVVSGAHKEHLYVGRVKLNPGNHQIKVAATGQFKNELFQLRDLRIDPVKIKVSL